MAAFEAESERQRQKTSLASQRNKNRKALAPDAVQGGQTISLRLLTSIYTEHPGKVIAEVIQNSLASNGDIILPKGTRLFGTYSSRIGGHSTRLSILWESIKMVDGRVLYLEKDAMITIDTRGSSGVEAKYDNHTGELLFTTALLSVIGVIANNDDGDSSGASFKNQVSLQFGSVSNKLIDRSLNKPRRLALEIGTELKVLLLKPLSI